MPMEIVSSADYCRRGTEMPGSGLGEDGPVLPPMCSHQGKCRKFKFSSFLLLKGWGGSLSPQGAEPVPPLWSVP